VILTLISTHHVCNMKIKAAERWAWRIEITSLIMLIMFLLPFFSCFFSEPSEIRVASTCQSFFPLSSPYKTCTEIHIWEWNWEVLTFKNIYDILI
jgi:hypothetical protein